MNIGGSLMDKYSTLIELIETRKREEHKGITFILGDSEETYVSYKQLYYTSLKLLDIFQNAGYKKGDEIIFQIDNNEMFVYSFWACILGGLIPVPVTTGNNDEHRLKLFKIWSILNNPKILSSREFIEKLDTFAQKNNLAEKFYEIKTNVIFVDENIIENSGNLGTVYHTEPSDLAFIQFSSGSTGDPKGVMITHNNVIVDVGSGIAWNNIDDKDVCLNWMPLTHDMGLIGTHIKGVMANINQYNIQTQLFIRHPSLWIQKASEHRATLLYSPNFGYKHFLKFYNSNEKKEWDLSSVRLIYNGAEPISLDLCNEFLDKMAIYGLNRKAMHPVYGLAEGTISVTAPKEGNDILYHVLKRSSLNIGQKIIDTSQDDYEAVIFVDEGYPIFNSFIRICDEKNNHLGESKVGYIHISGGNVTSGYYNNPEATKNIISEDGWLNTGDLGFLRDGRLTITGRAKDIIFVAGQNYYAHDIERVCEEIDGVELGKIAAVGAFNYKLGSDQIILFLMHRQKIEALLPLASKIKIFVAQKIGIEVAEVIPVRSIPKTTSGKVQRYKLRESFINGEFDTVREQIQNLISENSQETFTQEATLVQKTLIDIWSQVLGRNDIGIFDNFFELGGDSLKVTQIQARISEVFGKDINYTIIFENSDINMLSKIIEDNDQKYTDKFESNDDTLSNPCLLSYSQQRLWFLERLNPGSYQYNISKGLFIRGDLNIKALEDSFNKIIRRYKVLQSYFVEDNGVPVQRYNEEATLNFNYTDLRNVYGNKKELEIENTIISSVAAPFNLEKAPLLRAQLMHSQEKEYLLILTAHHIIFDGWSFGVLLKELNMLYECITQKNKIEIETPVQYSEFIGWQRSNLNTERYKEQLEYWRNKLGSGVPNLDLSLDKPRPVIAQYKGNKISIQINEELKESLNAYAKSHNATLFMVLFAAFNTLLYKYTGQTDIVVGSPIANRAKSCFENTIGYFTNNIVLRTVFSQENTFNQLMSTVKRVAVEAYSNQDVPFEKLVEELNIERDMSRNPVFQVLFAMQNTPLQEMKFSDISITTFEIDGQYSRFDLSVDIGNLDKGLYAEFEYNSDLFEKATIERMAVHYVQLIKEISINPDEELSSYCILTEDEKKFLLTDINNTFSPMGTEANWVELFRQQTALTPSSVAAICSNESLTYEELNKKSDQLAQYLISFDIKSEDIVAVFMDRSLNMLISLLAIHKAGAAYLPMDPIFPRDRLEYMLEDADVKAVLTEGKLKELLPNNPAKTILLDEESQEIYVDSSVLLPSFLSYPTNNLAYVIYTSGSTGKPKGVQIEQYALINFLKSMVKNTGINSEDSLLAVTTLSFDIAGLELYMPLICGARIVLAQRDEITDGKRLIELINRYNISLMQATPATWRLLNDSGWSGNKNMTILCGGEAFPRELANELLDKCAVLLNVYGPTETTIWSTLDQIKEKDEAISIGKPIDNTQIYVVDEKLNLVPIGVPGELLIGGTGLARGYMKLPELTKEKFIFDIFSGIKGARLYRTGDIVKIRNDGKIEFVGRKDNQEKIRGYRIELGEIESLLNKISGIKQAIVAAKEIIQGEKSLVAYLQLENDADKESVKSNSIKNILKEKLPDYMIPVVFTLMDKFPLTPNGKIDRKALPTPKVDAIESSENYKAPVNEIESKLVLIWKEALKRDTVGTDDNFFDLGGHSLLLAQVRSKISSVVYKDIPMMELFKYPTISSLAAFLASDGEENSEVTVRKKFNTQDNRIAVIGLSGRFPGANNIDEFWNNLCKGQECISSFSDEQIMEEGVDPEILSKPGYVKAWGVLEDIDKFDAQFFGYNPREAEVLDPQQRIFLEESWKALENAGYDPDKFDGLIGVYASMGMNTYLQNLQSAQTAGSLASDYQMMISNDKDFVATRVAYKLNLEGPALTVQTACSSSLVAVHLACQSLLNSECDMALAGGVSIRMPQKSGYMYQEGMILSPDGHCRAFDENSKGTVGGNGAGVVILKRYNDAVSDGDDISAVVLGTAINNDGSLKIGYTAPRIDGQAKAIAEAYSKAGISADTISYVETHGTGTSLGDPIEVEALTKVFNGSTHKKQFCAIGSVKPNIGHLDAAAGITGFIKTVLTLRNREIPPSINFEKPNPKINFRESPFYVNTKLASIDKGDHVIRAGVSSFGIGGTNAHAVLESVERIQSNNSNGESAIIMLSAKSRKSLDRMVINLKNFFDENRDVNIYDVAYTLQIGRREFEYRKCFVCHSVEEAIEKLENILKQEAASAGDKKFGKIVHVDNPKEHTLQELAELWINGNTIDWKKINENQKRKRIPLPTYMFDGQSFWVSRQKKDLSTTSNADLKKTKVMNIDEWFYTPVWKQSTNIAFDAVLQNNDEAILVLSEANEFLEVFTEVIKKKNNNVMVVTTGMDFKETGKGTFEFSPDEFSHFNRVLGQPLLRDKRLRIINLLGITDSTLSNSESLAVGKRLLYSLMYCAQAIGQQSIGQQVQMDIITNSTYKVFGEKQVFPEKSICLGACRVIPREYPNINCRNIDIVLPDEGSIEELAEMLSEEIYCTNASDIAAIRGLTKWEQQFEKIKLNSISGSGIKLKEKGVYLITGGLGGIGLETAEWISNEVNAQMILISRSDFPNHDKWDSYTKENGIRNLTSRKIKRLKSICERGSDICIYKADIASFEDAEILKKHIVAQYGHLDGIIHAAGTSGGGMIQLKRKADAESVLLPKVRGTNVLSQTFNEMKPDFVLLYSSLNAITGGFGQMDYSAANAFMDVFAAMHDNKRGTRYIAINWDRWPGVGMASIPGTVNVLEEHEIHPLLGKKIFEHPDKIIYCSELFTEKDWVLSEHLVLDMPTLAGTTYLEMARSAFEDITGKCECRISDVLFMNPLSVKGSEKRTVYTVLIKEDEGYIFKIISKLSGEEVSNAFWLEHIRGKLEPQEGICCVKEIDSILEFDGGVIFSRETNSTLSQEFIRFGPRWNSLERFLLKDNEGLVSVRLDESFAKELSTFKLHPALLDVATGAVRLATGGNYLPFSYQTLKIYAQLEDFVFAVIKFKNEYTSMPEAVTCDIEIISKNGRLLIEISNFSMKLISDSVASSIKNRIQGSKSDSVGMLVKETFKNDILSEGISASEGKEALNKIINSCFTSQILVSTKDIQVAMQQANYFEQSGMKNSLEEVASAREKHPRPDLESEFVPPKSESEKKLAALWQEVLAIDKVGIHDEFFALGGDSLLLIQFHTKLKEVFSTDIAVVELYKYNTVSLLSKYLSSPSEEKAPVFDDINNRANKQKELMQRRRQILQRGKGVDTDD